IHEYADLFYVVCKLCCDFTCNFCCNLSFTWCEDKTDKISSSFFDSFCHVGCCDATHFYFHFCSCSFFDNGTINSCISSATEATRINDSPTRIALAPAASTLVTSDGCSIPLSLVRITSFPFTISASRFVVFKSTLTVF